MKKYAVALIACFNASFALNSHAENLGAIGPVYGIVERDLMEVLKARGAAKVKDGSWNKAMEDHKQKVIDYAHRPIGKHLPRAVAYSVRYFDPTVELDMDVTDAEGKVMYPKGTRVNPLDYRDYTRTLCFFDGDDKAQVEWARSYCFDPVNARAILVNGPLIELSQKYNTRMYFDQYGVLIGRFGIKAVPTVIRQTGKVFAVEEFGVRP